MTEQPETGSDDQMTDEQREELERQSDVAEAEEVEEERKTEAQPVDGEDEPA